MFDFVHFIVKYKPVSYTHLDVYKRQFLFQAEMEELAEEVQIHDTAKEVTGKLTMDVKENPLFVCELMEPPGGKVAEDEVTQEVVDENRPASGCLLYTSRCV